MPGWAAPPCGPAVWTKSRNRGVKWGKSFSLRSYRQIWNNHILTQQLHPQTHPELPVVSSIIHQGELLWCSLQFWHQPSLFGAATTTIRVELTPGGCTRGGENLYTHHSRAISQQRLSGSPVCQTRWWSACSSESCPGRLYNSKLCHTQRPSVCLSLSWWQR